MLRFSSFVLVVFASNLEAQMREDGFPLPEGAIHRFGNRQLRHPETITAAAVSPNGKYLATLGSSSVVVWDLKTLRAKFCMSSAWYGGYGYGDRNAALWFLPDSRSLLVAVRPTDRTSINVNEVTELAQVWDIETGKIKFGLKGQWGFVFASWPCKEGKEIALLAGYDEQCSIKYFNASDGKELRSVKSPFPNRALWISGNGAVAAGPNPTGQGFLITEAETGKELHRIDGGQQIQAALSHDGKRAAYHDNTGKVTIHDVTAKKELLNFKHPADKQRGPMYFSKDQQTLYFGGQHGQLYRWDLKNNKQLPDVGRHSSWSLTTFAVSPDESILYSMGGDRLIKRWNVKTGEQLPLPEGYTTMTTAVPAMDGKHVIICDHAGTIDLWDLKTGKRARQLQPGRFGGINCVAVSPDGRWLAGGRTVQDFQLWDLTTGKLHTTIGLVDKPDSKGSDHVQRVFFRGDSKMLFTVSGKTGLTAWEVPSGKQVWRTPIAGNLAAIAPAGRWIATGGGFNQEAVQISFLNATTGDAVRTINVSRLPDEQQKGANYPPYVMDLAFSPDGSKLVTAHYDRSLRIWDVDTAKEVHQILGDRTGQKSLAISPDGRWVAASRSDKRLTIWELASGKEVFALPAHDSNIRDAAFTRDSRGIIGNADLSPVLWSLKPKDLPNVDIANDELWSGLASEDGKKSYRLLWALANDPKRAIALFNERIKPAELAMPRTEYDKLLANLDHPQFRVREAAESDLTKAGSKLPIPWLRQSLSETKSDEVRARLGRILTQREKPDPTEWRIGRAVQVLELAATDDAKTLLKSWAESGTSALALDAKAAIERLRN